jgi:hypothetical protein
MSIYNINIDEIRLLLQFKGISLDDYDNDELEILIRSKIMELEGFIGADIHPHDRTEVRKNFTNTLFTLSYYPLLNIHQVYLNDMVVCREDYNVNYETGVVYFNHDILSPPVHYYPRRFGKGYGKSRGSVLKIEYTTGCDDIFFNNHILPLLTDMLAYTISYGQANKRLNGLAGFVNSVKEGDLSMSFGGINGSGGKTTDYGYGSGVNGKIDELCRMFKYNSKVAII